MAPEVGNGEAKSSSPLLIFSHQCSTFICGQSSDSCVLWHAYLRELHEILEFIGSLSSHNLHGWQKSPAGKSFKWSSPKSQHVMGPFVRGERRGNLWICFTGELIDWEEDVDRVTLGGVIDTRAASHFLPLFVIHRPSPQRKRMKLSFLSLPSCWRAPANDPQSSTYDTLHELVPRALHTFRSNWRSRCEQARQSYPEQTPKSPPGGLLC